MHLGRHLGDVDRLIPARRAIGLDERQLNDQGSGDHDEEAPAGQPPLPVRRTLGVDRVRCPLGIIPPVP